MSAHMRSRRWPFASKASGDERQNGGPGYACSASQMDHAIANP